MDEKERAFAELRDAADRLLHTVRVSPGQWRLAPPGAWSPAQIIEHVAISCDRIARLPGGAHLAAKPGVRHPVFGVLDGMQWLPFAPAHVERHRAQAIGAQSQPGYPR